MEPDSMRWVSAVEFVLQRRQAWVVPWRVSQANLFNDPTDKPIVECLVQPVWEVLMPGLSSIAFSILVNTGQNEWLGG